MSREIARSDGGCVIASRFLTFYWSLHIEFVFLPCKIIEKNTWVIAWYLSGFNISLETRRGGGADISADNVQNLAEKQSLGGKCEVFVDNLSAKDIIS